MASLFETGFPRPVFADRDPQVLTAAIIAEYEALIGRKLFPAQLERLLANLQAYRETGVRVAVQYTGEQNLVSFAQGNHLDYLGEMLNCTRLAASPARCTLRFTLREVPIYSVAIPKGTTVSAGRQAGQIHWLTQQSAIVHGSTEGGPAHLDTQGQPYVDVVAEANTYGTTGNGFEPGEVSILVTDPFPFFHSVANIDQTRQGAPIEDDDRYRRRLLLAPEGFAGGSVEAYQYRALSTNPAIVDVSCHQTTPGHLIVSVLMRDGKPSQDTLSQVAKALKPDKRRPLTDWVTVAAPVEVDVSINITVTPFVGWDASGVELRARTALHQFIAERLPKLGVDIVPSQIIAQVGDLPGVYRVEVHSPTYREMEVNEWVNYSQAINIAIAPAEPG